MQSDSKMKLLCWFALLLCLCVNAENITVWRESGEDVNLRCSTAGCSSRNEGYDGLDLYHMGHAGREKVLYYHADLPLTEHITPEGRFKNRTQKEGSLKNHTITIRELTVDDSGLYSCVFLCFPDVEAQCSVHTLFVRGVAPCPRSTADEKCPPLVQRWTFLWITIAACTVGTVATLIFILLIVPRVRRWWSSRGRTASVPQQVPNDNEYEVMTKKRPHLPREGPPPGPQALV